MWMLDATECHYADPKSKRLRDFPRADELQFSQAKSLIFRTVHKLLAHRPVGRAHYSNFGSVVGLAGPGGDQSTGNSNGMLSTLNAGTTTPGADSYAYYQGAAMATPHVAGVVALMYAVKPRATPDQIKSARKSSARAFPATCSQCGTGIVDAPGAVAAITRDV